MLMAGRGQALHSGLCDKGAETTGSKYAGTWGVWGARNRSALTRSWTVQVPVMSCLWRTHSQPNGANIPPKYLNFICWSSREDAIMFYSKMLLRIASSLGLGTLTRPSTSFYNRVQPRGGPQIGICKGVQNSRCPGNLRKIYIGCPHPHKPELGEGTHGAGPFRAVL